MDWPLIQNELVTLAVAGGTSLLVHNSVKLARIAAILSNHVKEEEVFQRVIRGRLKRVEKKLPNGEVEKMYRMLLDLHGKLEPGEKLQTNAAEARGEEKDGSKV